MDTAAAFAPQGAAAEKRKPNPRRAELRELSAQVRPLVKAGMFATVNEGLLHFYKEQTGASEWHTFHDWRKEGRPVKKGERGFPIWGTPRAMNAGGESQDPAGYASNRADTDQQHPMDFFPVCYLFHAGQVEASTQLQGAA